MFCLKHFNKVTTPTRVAQYSNVSNARVTRKRTPIKDTIVEPPFEIYSNPAQSDFIEKTESGDKLSINGITLDDIVTYVKEDSPLDMSVINMKNKCSWVDYVVSVNGKSSRHLQGMAGNVIQKLKARINELSAKNSQERSAFYVEGKNSKDWIAIDCGSIIIQFFSATARREYDTDRLWTIEAEEEMSEDRKTTKQIQE